MKTNHMVIISRFLFGLIQVKKVKREMIFLQITFLQTFFLFKSCSYVYLYVYVHFENVCNFSRLLNIYRFTLLGKHTILIGLQISRCTLRMNVMIKYIQVKDNLSELCRFYKTLFWGKFTLPIFHFTFNRLWKIFHLVSG